ncbi:hypothetical protein BJY01DRAFT_103968 [Aspergillus pseudoustus]|uniref:Uncharacterized protein n=1 Tax=Aspergillus pseudoustus TaxID=1810923 RepID=A0ABR4KI73_9EURO
MEEYLISEMRDTSSKGCSACQVTPCHLITEIALEQPNHLQDKNARLASIRGRKHLLTCPCTCCICPYSNVTQGQRRIFQTDPVFAICSTELGTRKSRVKSHLDRSENKQNKYLREWRVFRAGVRSPSLVRLDFPYSESSTMPLFCSPKARTIKDFPYSWYWEGKPLRTGYKRGEFICQVRTDICPQPRGRVGAARCYPEQAHNFSSRPTYRCRCVCERLEPRQQFQFSICRHPQASHCCYSAEELTGTSKSGVISPNAVFADADAGSRSTRICRHLYPDS